MYKFDLRCKGKDNLPNNNELSKKILKRKKGIAQTMQNNGYKGKTSANFIQPKSRFSL